MNHQVSRPASAASHDCVGAQACGIAGSSSQNSSAVPAFPQLVATLSPAAEAGVPAWSMEDYLGQVASDSPHGF